MPSQKTSPQDGFEAEEGFEWIGSYFVPEAEKLFAAFKRAKIRYRSEVVPGDGYHAFYTELVVSTESSRRKEVHAIHRSLFGDCLPDFGSSFFRPKRRVSKPRGSTNTI